jgi:hypothetical protein
VIPVVPLAYILPGPLFQPEQRASDADRDTAVDILCEAVAEGRLTLAELDERVGAALSARTIGELAALIADLSGPWTPVPASASARVSPSASPGWASRALERWSLLQSLASSQTTSCWPRRASSSRRVTWGCSGANNRPSAGCPVTPPAR